MKNKCESSIKGVEENVLRRLVQGQEPVKIMLFSNITEYGGVTGYIRTLKQILATTEWESIVEIIKIFCNDSHSNNELAEKLEMAVRRRVDYILVPEFKEYFVFMSNKHGYERTAREFIDFFFDECGDMRGVPEIHKEIKLQLTTMKGGDDYDN